MIINSERSTGQCARIWSENLQLLYTSKLEVIRDQTAFKLLVYNLQLPHGRHGHHSRHGSHCDHGGRGEHGDRGEHGGRGEPGNHGG